MSQNFVIKEGKKNTFYFLVICLFIFVFRYRDTQSYIGLSLLVFLSIPLLLYLILFFRWKISYAVFLDIEKQEIILNHALTFRKKRISLKDIKEVDTLNGNIILFGSTPLSKLQRMVCKTKKSKDYTVCFEAIETCEKRELMGLLSVHINKSKE